MYKVLYVEDNFENYKLVEFVLSNKGFKVYNAIDGIDAIDKAKEIMPDLIIMDINLPNLMGYEATLRIKSDEALKQIPIIALTAAYSDEYKELCLSTGCIDYFTKPIDPLSFPDILKDVIENYQKQISLDESKKEVVQKEITKSLEEKAREILKLNEQLANYEDKLIKTLANISDIIFILDENFYLKFYNNAAVENKKFVILYLENKTFFDIFDVGTEDLTKIKTMLKNKQNISNLELLLKVDDECDMFLANFTHLGDEIAVSLRKVNDESEIHSRILHLEKLASIGQITAGIIHEVNNPMTAIRNYFEILKMKYLSQIKDDSVEKIIERIEYGFNKIENLSNTLLSFARPSKEKKYPININSVVKDIIEFGEYELKRGDINIELNLDNNIGYILAVKSQIEQAIMNILINAHYAVKYVEKPLIKIKTYEKDEKICICIFNNGPKIPDEIKEKIFEPFFSTKPDSEGTGLGLTIVRQVANKHNAELSVFSDEIGTEFVIKFNKMLES